MADEFWGYSGWSAQGMLRKLQIGHEELKGLLEERVQNVQLLETSPGGLTCILYTDVDGGQQQHCEMPFKSPMALIGPGKHQCEWSRFIISTIVC